MIRERYLRAESGGDRTESLAPSEKQGLQRAMGKIVAFGAESGVTPDQMIELLKSGLTVAELLEYLAARTSDPQ
jgi:hypothetical protein